ncbi:21 kDa protein-like [Corylus avellana]|uniref:21 kDa protein-like n=1 Tax=Corylus avellana TaxID=13451 RepID=UPI001E20CE8A|nr:21 kDa protein-like [Corylus avellana]
MNTISCSKVFLVLLVTLLPNQILADQNLISSACDHTLYKKLCRKTLESDPESSSATSFEVLSKVALKHATSTATHINSKVTKLLNESSSKVVKGALKDCNENYQDAIEGLTKSSNALASKRYNDVNTWVSAAMSASDSCDQGFQDGGDDKSPLGKSPLGHQGIAFTRLCSIVLAITNQLK